MKLYIVTSEDILLDINTDTLNIPAERMFGTYQDAFDNAKDDDKIIVIEVSE